MSTTGYASYNAFKKAFGSAGKGSAWHHIVKQTKANINKFGSNMANNVTDVVKISRGADTLHQRITNFYNTKQGFTGG